MNLGTPDEQLLRCGVMRSTVDYLETRKAKLSLLNDPIFEVRPGIACVAARDSHTPGSQWIRVTTPQGAVILAGDNCLMYDNVGGVEGSRIRRSEAVYVSGVDHCSHLGVNAMHVGKRQRNGARYESVCARFRACLLVPARSRVGRVYPAIHDGRVCILFLLHKTQSQQLQWT